MRFYSHYRHFLPHEKWPDPDLLTKLKNQHGLTPIYSELSGTSTNIENLTLNGLKFPLKAFENNLQPTTAKILAQVNFQGRNYPVMAVNRYGKGLACYFGCSLPQTVSNWSGMRYNAVNSQNLEIILRFFQTLLDRTGIIPPVTAEDLPSTTIVTRHNGPILITGIIRDIAQTRNLDAAIRQRALKFDRPYHAYDVVNGKYLGFGRELKHEFGPFSQTVLALSPYQPGKPEIQLIRDDRSYTASIRLQAATEKWADHIFQVELKRPDGTINPAYSEVVFGNGNQGKYEFTLPLNSAPGNWTLLVTDVLSGQQQSITIPTK